MEAEEFLYSAICQATKDSDAHGVCILLDGLDETETYSREDRGLTTHLTRILRRGVPNNVRFVLSSRPTRQFEQLVGEYSLDLSYREGQASAIEQYLAQNLRETSKAERQRIASKAKGSFLMAKAAVRWHVDTGGKIEEFAAGGGQRFGRIAALGMGQTCWSSA